MYPWTFRFIDQPH